MNPIFVVDLFESRLLEKILHSDFGLGAQQHILVAFSGGLDSTVLLHSLLHIDDIASERITALHVNHGLNQDAPLWERHCEELCLEWRVEFRSHCVQTGSGRGRGTEAAAREARYQWFSGQMTRASVLMTAHHYDDHVETVMAGFFRGSGVRGLAGIRAVRPFACGELWRPLLGVTRSDLARYAGAHDLRWIEDPMNAEHRFTRNHLRHKVLPVVREKWPGVDKVIARSAENWLDASNLLDEIAESDLATVRLRTEGASHMLFIPDLLKHSRLRMANTLRLWFVQCGFGTPSRRRLFDIMQSLIDRKPEPTCLVSWPGTEIRRYRDWLYLSTTREHRDFQGLLWDWHGQQSVQINGRMLITSATTGNGIRKSVCESSEISVRPRQGGETCRVAGRGCSKKLKKIFQEKGIPPWLREDFPLLYVGDELAGVAGICYCHPFAANGDEPGVVFDLAEVADVVNKVESTS